MKNEWIYIIGHSVKKAYILFIKLVAKYIRGCHECI